MNEETPDRRKYRNEWHLDKRLVVGIITLVSALVGGLITQTAVLIRWGSGIQASIERQAEINSSVKARLDSLTVNAHEANRLSERVVRVEAMLENVNHTVNKIDVAIDPLVRGQRNGAIKR